MTLGPLLNKIDRNFTTRDSLGIEGVATSMSADLCPVVNTVTPRAFYWPFMVWIYYDFYMYSGIEERTVSAFDKYLKRQDYFFVMATLLTEGSDRRNLVGITQAEKDIKGAGPYPFNPNYFKTRYGGMQYYNAGCLTMQFVTEEDNQGNLFSFPRLTKLGEKMALAFEKVIKDTEYYKKYRRNEKAVPRKVLEEYGKRINIGLKGFKGCKSILRERLFDADPKLRESADYITFLHNSILIDTLDLSTCRRAFFDHRDPNGKRIKVPKGLKNISDGWEIVVGRQYFTSGLEMIWKPMLELITVPMDIQKWIDKMISTSEFNCNLKAPLKNIIPECRFDFDDREDMIYDARMGNEAHRSIENGMRIILSMYNWLMDRQDFGDERVLLEYGIDSQSIALTELQDTVDKFKDKSVKEFLVFIMQKWLVEQHYYTAFEKMLQRRDGFYYEIVDGIYHSRGYQFKIDFQGIRMVQLMQVMKDLDML